MESTTIKEVFGLGEGDELELKWPMRELDGARRGVRVCGGMWLAVGAGCCQVELMLVVDGWREYTVNYYGMGLSRIG